MKIIPAIDLCDGHCVRLLQGDFDQATDYSAHPAEIGRRFSALDVQDLHIVDLDGARTGKQLNRDIVAKIARQSGLAVQLGGGIRTRSDVENWLAAGVRRCVVGSVAINDPETVKGWINEFGGDSIVLALDVRVDEQAIPYLATQGWTKDSEHTLWDCLDSYADVDVRHVLCTDIARDGAMIGPNFNLYHELLQRYPTLSLQASGGVRDLGDLQKLRHIGVPAAITGRALLDGEITAQEIASFRQSA